MERRIDKQRVAESFSRAAESYDSVAELQREIGTELAEQLPQIPVRRMLDLGCGTGFFTPLLRQRYPQAELINLDLAQGMLSYARENRFDQNAVWLCADAEALPLADNSIDLIFSTLAIQWCENVSILFAEIARVLRPGGQFFVATLGPDTLLELKNAWQAVDNFTHVNRFLPATQFIEACPDTLSVNDFKESFKVLQYSQLKELTDELKGIGAHNMNAGQQTGLTGRERIRRFKRAYEAQRNAQGYLPATYQVFFGAFEKGKQN
ncbi:MAG: malonyl-[acyl-carrier protein] O-methyltransferase BioC [Neptuniibacter caesariensis]|uniref:Malonyl-[acyl-carrier protein] O-methyltransferase n=1 Tax=Neptuniibacter caesariensis TaxID=207954 RepID=A0A2G6JNB3_NEPCE|nr:MAG: malonyl-[acyl-carrier protein] O-methyltransferase BioC [Neptuniibacter caesariensis]